MYAYIHIGVKAFSYCISMGVYICKYFHSCACVCLYVCVCVCMYVYVYVWVFVCVRVGVRVCVSTKYRCIKVFSILVTTVFCGRELVGLTLYN